MHDGSLLFEQIDVVTAPFPYRYHHAAPVGELLDQRLRHFLCGRGYDDRVVGSVGLVAGPAVTDNYLNVAISRANQVLPTGGSEGLVPFDRCDVGRQERQQRGLKAIASSDLEHSVGRPRPRRIDHPRDKRRLARGLFLGNADGTVAIGLSAKGFGDEVTTVYGSKRLSDSSIVQSLFLN
jgi:hypothetical protein